jgi:hypothetical protein
VKLFKSPFKKKIQNKSLISVFLSYGKISHFLTPYLCVINLTFKQFKIMTQSKEFMLLFRFEPTGNQPTEAEMAEMHQRWGAFIGGIAIQEKLISTHQLGFMGMQIASNKEQTDGIYVANNHTLGGNMILKANGMAEAVEIAKNCPILHMGGSVEVRDIMPM